MRKVERAARPQVTVIRDDKARSVDPSHLVVGDVVVVGPGDQLIVDGQVIGDGRIVVDESLLSGDSTRQAKRGGKVFMRSQIGGVRVVDVLSGEQLPRIC